MATSPSKAVDLIRDEINKSSSDVITLQWNEFYSVVDRERMGDEFMRNLSRKAKESGLHVSFGNSVVVIAKDYPFNPRK